MAITYQRNTWETGKVITAKALNDIETGIVDIVEKLNGMDGEVASQILTVEDDASIGGDASISGNTDIGGNISIGGTATITGKATFNGPVEISGATTINNDITVGAGKYLILSESPNNDNHAAAKGYVDGEVTTINSKKITSANDGIIATGTLGSGISIELKPASTTTLGGIKVGDKLSFTDSILNLPVASTSVFGGIKVGTNLSIDDYGVLSATDTTYALANTTTDGLMSSNHFNKLENNVVTGISINGGTTQSPTNGVVNLSVITDITGKADAASPSFTGVANFGSNIRIDGNAYKIIIGSAELSETQLNSLYSILPQDNIQDGEYTLKLSKSTVDNEPVFTYSWELVNNTGGGE